MSEENEKIIGGGGGIYRVEARCLCACLKAVSRGSSSSMMTTGGRRR
jgi:hypothetical protein